MARKMANIVASNNENQFEDLTSERFKIDPIEISNILEREIQIDGGLKSRLETCIYEKGKRKISIGPYTSHIAAGKNAQDIVFANQLFAVAAKCIEYANAVDKYLSYIEDNIKNNVVREPNVFPKKAEAEAECKARLIESLNSLDLDDGDKEKLHKFLFDEKYPKGGKEVFNCNKISTTQNKGQYEIKGRSDVLGSCVLGILNISNASSDCMGIILRSLVQEPELYKEINDILLKNSRKKEIYRNSVAVEFYRQVLTRTLKNDPNLSKLGGMMDSRSVYWKINGYNVGRNVNTTGRLSDYSTDIRWRVDRRAVCANLEIESDSMVNNFFPAYNQSYKDEFLLAREGGDFVMYEYSKNILPNISDFKTTIQKIFFGAPGTGKSYAIDYGPVDINSGVKDGVKDKCTFRTTFHPDYDYAQFVGTFKPHKDECRAKICQAENDNGADDSQIVSEMTYDFSPQVLANAYLTAWKRYFDGEINLAKDKNVYLVIEEINRGNCAQIFGDLFQLLDRDENGLSRYSIVADKDFGDWLTKELRADLVSLYNKVVCKETSPLKSLTYLRFPPNLNILATMNTSDQSLFPMDSAFKRRFDWEYVPINYKMPKADFKVGGDDLEFDWLHFLKKVNADIRSVTESEDKQMGEFFIKPKDNGNITLEEFRSKVLFYLWDTVYKDETDKKHLFHFPYPEKGPDITFQRLFEDDEAGKISDNSKKIIRKMLETLDAAYDTEEYKDFKIFPVKTESPEDK